MGYNPTADREHELEAAKEDLAACILAALPSKPDRATEALLITLAIERMMDAHHALRKRGE